MRTPTPPPPLIREPTAQERLDQERLEIKYRMAGQQQDNRTRSTALDQRARAEQHQRKKVQRATKLNRRLMRSNPRDRAASTSPTNS